MERIADQLYYNACLNDLVQLGQLIRIFSLHGELRIGTNEHFNRGCWIWFSNEDDAECCIIDYKPLIIFQIRLQLRQAFFLNFLHKHF